jgi:hypothetical protein
VNRRNRQARRRAGKSDPLDAIEAARAALSGRACGAAKSRDGNVVSAYYLVCSVVYGLACWPVRADGHCGSSAAWVVDPTSLLKRRGHRPAPSQARANRDTSRIDKHRSIDRLGGLSCIRRA